MAWYPDMSLVSEAIRAIAAVDMMFPSACQYMGKPPFFWISGWDFRLLLVIGPWTPGLLHKVRLVPWYDFL
jgi:hypothetical protein